jgi:hypothetical protein
MAAHREQVIQMLVLQVAVVAVVLAVRVRLHLMLQLMVEQVVLVYQHQYQVHQHSLLVAVVVVRLVFHPMHQHPILQEQLVLVVPVSVVMVDLVLISITLKRLMEHQTQARVVVVLVGFLVEFLFLLVMEVEELLLSVFQIYTRMLQQQVYTPKMLIIDISGLIHQAHSSL